MTILPGDEEDFLDVTREEAEEASERIALRSILRIWMFSLRNSAQNSLDIMNETLEWIEKRGPRATVRDLQDRLDTRRKATLQGDQRNQRQWNRLLAGTDRHYHINPRRLLRNFEPENDGVVLVSEGLVATV